MIKPTSLSIIDVPFRVYKTHDPKADYVAYKELLIDRIDRKKIEADKLDQTQAIDRAEKINLDRQPKVSFTTQDIPLLSASASQYVTPLLRTQVQNYARAIKIPVGHYLDLDV